jgi:perosamine synthetase
LVVACLQLRTIATIGSSGGVDTRNPPSAGLWDERIAFHVMTERSIPFGQPMIDEAERKAVANVLSGTTLVHGPVTHAFEHAFAERAGAKHAVSLSSCTAGLHMSLFCLGVKPGDKVIVPAITHVATAHAVEFCGAEPVFVDVQPDSGNIDPKGLAAAMNEDIRAIEIVHFIGLPCEMDEIDPIAKKWSVPVIEDCAIAIDATYGGKKVGTLGAVGAFSFYPTKHMTTIEGGMIVTNDESLSRGIAQRKAFGYDKTVDKRSKPGIYDVTVLGYNYRMNEVQAAVGYEQLKKLDGFQQARTRNYRELKQVLSDIVEVTVFEDVRGKAVSTHYCLNATLPRDGSVDRDKVMEALRAAGIGVSVHYPSAVPLLSYYREKYGYRDGQFPVAEWLANQTISLPVGPHLQDGDVSRIGAAMKDAVRRARN